MKLLYLPFIGAPFVFITNLILSCFTKINEFDIEMRIYPYAEENAKVITALSLAIAIFSVIGIKENVRELPPKNKVISLANILVVFNFGAWRIAFVLGTNR